MRPGPGQVLHFSEDPAIAAFVPHVAASARHRTPYVWAVDHARAPAYWFPRQCPRVMAWIVEHSDADDIDRIIGPGGGSRVHAVEYAWLDRMRTTDLFAYRLPAEPFAPIGEPEPHAHVSTRAVRPLGPAEPVGDLFDLHEAAGIQLRVLDRLDGYWEAVRTSSLGFSGIRLGNARSSS